MSLLIRRVDHSSAAEVLRSLSSSNSIQFVRYAVWIKLIYGCGSLQWHQGDHTTLTHYRDTHPSVFIRHCPTSPESGVHYPLSGISSQVTAELLLSILIACCTHFLIKALTWLSCLTYGVRLRELCFLFETGRRRSAVKLQPVSSQAWNFKIFLGWFIFFPVLLNNLEQNLASAIRTFDLLIASERLNWLDIIELLEQTLESENFRQTPD